MRWILTLAVLLLASPAGAGTWWKDCDSGQALSPAGSPSVQGTEKVCYEIGASETAANGDSTEFEVKAESALITFDSNTGATAIGLGRVEPRVCMTGTKPAANPTFTCLSLGELDGTEGASGTQNFALRVGPGVYYLDVSVDMSAASRVTIQAEKN